MKRLVPALVMLSMLPIVLISCNNNEKRNDSHDLIKAKNSVTSQNEEMFDPGETWKLIWADEFDKESIDENNWNFQVLEAGHFNDEWQRYTESSENAYIEDGCLVIKAIHESDVHGMDQYTSARMHTANKQSWKYGKIAARIQLPFSNGLWPAFWMLGSNITEIGGDTPWPQSGEIDILELYGSKNDSVVEANIHYADASNKHGSMGAASYILKEGRFADAFHIFELDWDADSMVWSVDGNKYASTPITAEELSEFHNEFYILLNIAVGNRHAGRPDSESVFPQYMNVDWIRVYQKE